MEIIKENPLRTLARSPYWLTIYNRAKELKLKLFENDSDFSQIQILFLQYLESIANLYLDLALGEELLCDEAINDWIRAEAYLLYKQKQKKEEKLGIRKNSASSESIVFIPKRK